MERGTKSAIVHLASNLLFKKKKKKAAFAVKSQEDHVRMVMACQNTSKWLSVIFREAIGGSTNVYADMKNGIMKAVRI